MTELHPPCFIIECRKTLSKIESVLERFLRDDHQSLQANGSSSKSKVSRFRRLESKDLKWPLRKSETMQIIEALERHKATCTIALAENSLTGIHMALEQTKLSNKCLENLKKNQEKLLEIILTQEQGMSSLQCDEILHRYIVRADRLLY